MNFPKLFENNDRVTSLGACFQTFKVVSFKRQHKNMSCLFYYEFFLIRSLFLQLKIGILGLIRSFKKTMNLLKKWYKAYIKISMQKIPVFFRVFCAYFGAKAWR